MDIEKDIEAYEKAKEDKRRDVAKMLKRVEAAEEAVLPHKGKGKARASRATYNLRSNAVADLPAAVQSSLDDASGSGTVTMPDVNEDVIMQHAQQSAVSSVPDQELIANLKRLNNIMESAKKERSGKRQKRIHELRPREPFHFDEPTTQPSQLVNLPPLELTQESVLSQGTPPPSGVVASTPPTPSPMPWSPSPPVTSPVPQFVSPVTPLSTPVVSPSTTTTTSGIGVEYEHNPEFFKAIEDAEESFVKKAFDDGYPYRRAPAFIKVGRSLLKRRYNKYQDLLFIESDLRKLGYAIQKTKLGTHDRLRPTPRRMLRWNTFARYLKNILALHV